MSPKQLVSHLGVVAACVVAACLWLPTAAWAEAAEAAPEGGGEEGGGGGGGGDEGDFDYDDGTGSVTIVEYGGGSREVHRAAREGRSLTITGVRGRRRGGFGSTPEYHRVAGGDTLWDLCRHYFANPWHWPRVWSYNPEITNPNWIYPGDRLRLLPEGQIVAPSPTKAGTGWVRSRRVRPGTIFMRSRGFIDREVLETSGIVVGSQEEVMLLAEHDEVYIEFEDDDAVRVGDEYTIFRADDHIAGVRGGRRDLGTLVEIMGAVRVISYDRDEQIARGIITESIHPIERGHRVGPLERRFEVTPPVQNEVELEGHIVAAVDPVQVIAQYYLVYIDIGRDDGVVEGNRLFVRRRRDMYRESLDEPDDRPGYPFEIVAELRIVETRERTATALVTRSVTDIHIGDRVEMRRGY